MFQKIVALITLVAFVAFLPGCTTVTVQTEPTTLPPEEAPVEIAGYTTRDGLHHSISGQARVASGWLIIRDASGVVYKGAVSEVVTIDVVETRVTGGGIAAIVVGAVLITLLIIFLVALATKTSCPFIYSWDGEKYVFDGEPYGGAVARALARTDYSHLGHLVPADGTYRLLLTNEVDETQHTDSLALLAVDHRPGDTVVLGTDGTVHAFEHRQRLSSARDEHGTDLSAFLEEVDQVSWVPDLDQATQQLPLTDTRNHLELAFPRPRTSAPVYLLTSAATAPWGSLQIRTLLGLRGTGVQAFYDAIDHDPAALKQLLAWNDREELYHLAVKVRVGDRWEKRAVMVAGGPFIAESRAIALDLTGVEGDTVHVRIDPPIGFWRLDALQLAWGEGPTKVQTLRARVARDETGRDVRAELERDDGVTLDQPQAPNVTRLEFDAPAVAPGRVRSVFARTHGWYQVHLHDLGEPDLVALTRLESEPGYAVQRALADYVEFKRTRVLPGIPATAQARVPATAGGKR